MKNKASKVRTNATFNTPGQAILFKRSRIFSKSRMHTFTKPALYLISIGELKFLSRSYVAMADDNYPKTADVVLGSPTEDNVASLCLAMGPTIFCTHTGSR